MNAVTGKTSNWKEHILPYWKLLKPRLSFLVIFSSAFGYFFAAREAWAWSTLLALCMGGFLITGASVIINQVIEKDIDARMKRTRHRPLAAGKVSMDAALTFAVIVGALGYLLLLSFTNPLTAYVALLSLLAYAILYTPLKRAGEVAVWVGAIPGALPPLLGVIAYEGALTMSAILLFVLQFVWQMPHFWAIAWLADEDYKNVGYRLLPRGGQCTRETAHYIMWVTALIILVPWLLWYYALLQLPTTIVLSLLGVWFWMKAVKLWRHTDRKSALQLMFASFGYLPLAQLMILTDRFLLSN
ncbi:MAG: protoheme IX farnesyltransferase [Thermonema sp.]|uniref:heme o synthase n=1 Tax=Thermonema TaxID=28194 RepID=UPI00057062D2|nr:MULTISPECIES: heme o synthase [Thermonema]GIV38795.1 MAG: protoheme IX farnesyltransferase [Thermonema sp.]